MLVYRRVLLFIFGCFAPHRTSYFSMSDVPSLKYPHKMFFPWIRHDFVNGVSNVNGGRDDNMYIYIIYIYIMTITLLQL